MLVLTIGGIEQYNELTNEFTSTKEQIITVEHSLVSLSKWESFWTKPFLTKEEKTYAETVDYIRCMTLTQNVDKSMYEFIEQDIINKVNDYIDAPMTATTFTNNQPQIINKEIITAEIIYYWMVTYAIPWEAQKWHLNRLLTLINVCNIKNQPQKKMSKASILARNKAINEARRKELNTKG